MGMKCLAQGLNTVPKVRLESDALPTEFKYRFSPSPTLSQLSLKYRFSPSPVIELEIRYYLINY